MLLPQSKIKLQLLGSVIGGCINRYFSAPDMFHARKILISRGMQK